MEADRAVGGGFPVNALNFAIEAGEPVGGFLEHDQVIEHRPGTVVIAFARHDNADAWRIDQRQRGGDAVFNLVDRQIIDFVTDKALGGRLR